MNGDHTCPIRFGCDDTFSALNIDDRNRWGISRTYYGKGNHECQTDEPIRPEGSHTIHTEQKDIIICFIVKNFGHLTKKNLTHRLNGWLSSFITGLDIRHPCTSEDSLLTGSACSPRSSNGQKNHERNHLCSGADPVFSGDQYTEHIGRYFE